MPSPQRDSTCGAPAMARPRLRSPSEPFDLVILDVMLPGLSGTEIVVGLRATSAVPIIMLTARDANSTAFSGLEIGADDYITKPFSEVELLSRVRRRSCVGGGSTALETRVCDDSAG